ncbi:MAG: alpha-E domain-containing protein [Blastocatellia bacterium]
MLSRVADSLFWMSRYIERAEDLMRVLAVRFLTLLDAGQMESEEAWRQLLTITYDEKMYAKLYERGTARDIIDFIVWNPANPNSVLWCVTMARENARGIREQISMEMWETLNRLYFNIRETPHEKAFRAPVEFFNSLREATQGFRGVTSETMTHSDPYEFIELGKHIERAEKTARIVGVKYETVRNLAPGSPEEALQLMAMLKSCSAFEPFRREHTSQLNAATIVEYLLLSHEFPRSVMFCLNRSLRAVNTINSIGEAAPSLTQMGTQGILPQRSLGKLVSELEYLEVSEVLGEHLQQYLEQLLRRLGHIGEDVTRSYFNTQVILPELHPQQAQQQQQQQQQLGNGQGI